jgi:SAM-dependent methyltransferase
MKACAAYFADNLLTGSQPSAQAIVPLMLELVRPQSVIDVGCGTGSWLAVFQQQGVADVCGVDGSWADRAMLAIPTEQFLEFDLEKPLRLPRKFDLVLSLEVAQHLPARCAEAFIDSLTRLGPVVFFSAAIPWQGGVGHVNEQWPGYWVRFFQQRRYVVLDPIRRKIWHDETIEWWFAQNLLMFVRRDYLKKHPLLQKEWETTYPGQLDLVHPRKYLQAAKEKEEFLRTIQDIQAVVPAQALWILVDAGAFEGAMVAGRRTLPFLERNGQYWGNPPDDATAIHELERLRRAGAGWLVFAAPAFWWFESYPDFSQHVRVSFRCVKRNDRVVIFDLGSPKRENHRGSAKRGPTKTGSKD